MKKVLKDIIKYIKNYDTIVIARHENSDLDCLGAQYGLKAWIEANFEGKRVYCIGEDHNYYSKSFVPKSDKISDIEEDFLGVCVDVNTIDRIDNKELFVKAKEKICIDHHRYSVDPDFDYYYIDFTSPACCEVLGEILLSSKNKKITKDVAKYLYSGIVSDSGDFYYESVDSNTFDVVSKLIKRGEFNPFNDVNIVARQRSFEELKLIGALINEIVYEGGLAYYIVNLEKLKELGVTAHAATEKINEFNRIQEFEIIATIAEISENSYKCSLRSKTINLVDVATKFGGGGHKNACGIRNLTLEKVGELKEELHKLIRNH